MLRPEAEHHIGEDQNRQVEQIAKRQTEMERLLEEVGEDRKEHCANDQNHRAVLSAIPGHRR